MKRRKQKKLVRQSAKKVIQEDTEVEFVCTLPGRAENAKQIEEPEPVQEQEEQEPDPELQNPEQSNDEQQQPEEHHNTEAPEGEVELSTNEEPQVGSNRKRKHGPTRMKDIAKDPNTRIHVDSNVMGDAYGAGSVKLSSYLAPLVREHVPVTLEGWKKLSEEVKTMLWKSVQVTAFIL